ncbi:MAG: hypothetical protein ACE5KM_05475 [Planctomycetaceae bacterium]
MPHVSCPHCASLLSSAEVKANACPTCDRPLVERPALVEPACGFNSNDSEWAFCPKCGNKLPHRGACRVCGQPQPNAIPQKDFTSAQLQQIEPLESTEWVEAADNRRSNSGARVAVGVSLGVFGVILGVLAGIGIGVLICLGIFTEMLDEILKEITGG